MTFERIKPFANYKLWKDYTDRHMKNAHRFDDNGKETVQSDGREARVLAQWSGNEGFVSEGRNIIRCIKEEIKSLQKELMDLIKQDSEFWSNDECKL